MMFSRLNNRFLGAGRSTAPHEEQSSTPSSKEKMCSEAASQALSRQPTPEKALTKGRVLEETKIPDTLASICRAQLQLSSLPKRVEKKIQEAKKTGAPEPVQAGLAHLEDISKKLTDKVLPALTTRIEGIREDSLTPYKDDIERLSTELEVIKEAVNDLANTLGIKETHNIFSALIQFEMILVEFQSRLENESQKEEPTTSLREGTVSAAAIGTEILTGVASQPIKFESTAKANEASSRGGSGVLAIPLTQDPDHPEILTAKDDGNCLLHSLCGASKLLSRENIEDLPSEDLMVLRNELADHMLTGIDRDEMLVFHLQCEIEDYNTSIDEKIQTMEQSSRTVGEAQENLSIARKRVEAHKKFLSDLSEGREPSREDMALIEGHGDPEKELRESEENFQMLFQIAKNDLGDIEKLRQSRIDTSSADGGLKDYIGKTRQNRFFLGQAEIHAFSELYNVQVQVYTPNGPGNYTQLMQFGTEEKEVICLDFSRDGRGPHYNVYRPS